jgi:uncharacterized protein (DUF433 family)
MALDVPSAGSTYLVLKNSLSERPQPRLLEPRCIGVQRTPDSGSDTQMSTSIAYASARTLSRIVVDPQILVGKPVVRGTRLAVELIVDLLAQGWSEEEILKNYPGLTREDLHACLKYASALIQSERVYPLLSR